MAGAFQIAREIFDNPIWQNITEFRLFFLIVGNAIFAEDGKEIAGIYLSRGQWLRSYRNLQSDLEYIENHAVKRLGIATIKRAIDSLVDDKRISIQATERGTLFTVLNYEKYQDLDNYRLGNAEQMRNTDGTDAEQMRNNNNKDNKENKEVYSLEIEKFRLRYSPEQLKIIDRYLEVLRTTRRSGNISDSVICGIYENMNKYDPLIVQYACMTVIKKPELHDKKESYFAGILRNTTMPEAVKGLQNLKTPPKQEWRPPVI